MKQLFGVGFIPFEINDKVVLRVSPEVFTIQDIRMIQYLKEKKIEFEVLIAGSWMPSDWIEKRIVDEVHYCHECGKEKVAHKGMVCDKCEFAREK